jgi:hypothetical protein
MADQAARAMNGPKKRNAPLTVSKNSVIWVPGSFPVHLDPLVHLGLTVA